MEDSELIRKYVRGKCSEKEQEEIQSRLKTDSEFASLYEEERIITVGIGLSERERLKQILQEKSTSNKRYIYIAAAVIPLLILSYFGFYANPDYIELYDQHYERYGVYEFGTERGSNQRDSLEILAFRSYKDGDFQLALDQLIKLNIAYQEEGYFLYQSVCLMELNRMEETIPILEKISKESDYYQIAQWYRALSLLKLQRIDECKSVLSELASAQGGLGKKAYQLLEEL